ncbi:MAG: hypothetical protein HY242_14130 [Afipia sp.]|nr:hypothetical protein [Afipia sp.]
MRTFFIFFTLSAVVAAIALSAEAAPMQSSGMANGAIPAITYVQAKKDETLKQKVKRVWRNLTGTTYDVGCPALGFAFTRTTCTETGKDAQASASPSIRSVKSRSGNNTQARGCAVL